MYLKKMTAIGACVCAVATVASEAWAASFQLTEQSVVTLGRAYSGAGITGDDVSAPFYNPAAMVFLPGTQMQLGVTGVTMNQVVKIERGTDAGTTNDGQNKAEFIPNFYITHQINPNWWVGLGIAMPFGLSTSYGQRSHGNWSYGNRGTEAELMDIDINPCFAWKPNDFFSFGGGISLQYAKAKLGLDAYSAHGTTGMPTTNGAYYLGHGEETGDSWAWGWNVGFVLCPTQTTRFSLSYRSAVKHNASGHFEFSPVSGGNYKFPSKVTIKLPDTVYASGLWQATDRLTLNGTIRWAKWKNSHAWTLRQDIPSAYASTLGILSSVPIRHHYRNTWLFALGADYKINEQWTVRGGVAYEEDAVDDQSYRVATIPDGDRLFLSLGASYNFNKNWSVDTALLWVQGLGTSEFYQFDRTDNPNTQRIGKWKTQHSLIYGLQLRYKF